MNNDIFEEDEGIAWGTVTAKEQIFNLKHPEIKTRFIPKSRYSCISNPLTSTMKYRRKQLRSSDDDYNESDVSTSPPSTLSTSSGEPHGSDVVTISYESEIEEYDPEDDTYVKWWEEDEEKSDGDEKVDKPDGVEKDKSDRVEKDDKSDRVEKDDKSDRVEKDDKSDRVEKDDKSDRVKKDDKSDRIQKDDKSDRVQKDDASDRVKKDDKSVRVKKDDKSDRVKKDDKSDRVQKDDKSDRVQKDDKTDRIQKNDKSDRFQKNDKSDRVKKDKSDVKEKKKKVKFEKVVEDDCIIIISSSDEEVVFEGVTNQAVKGIEMQTKKAAELEAAISKKQPPEHTLKPVTVQLRTEMKKICDDILAGKLPRDLSRIPELTGAKPPVIIDLTQSPETKSSKTKKGSPEKNKGESVKKQSETRTKTAESDADLPSRCKPFKRSNKPTSFSPKIDSTSKNGKKDTSGSIRVRSLEELCAPKSKATTNSTNGKPRSRSLSHSLSQSSVISEPIRMRTPTADSIVNMSTSQNVSGFSFSGSEVSSSSKYEVVSVNVLKESVPGEETRFWLLPQAGRTSQVSGGPKLIPLPQLSESFNASISYQTPDFEANAQTSDSGATAQPTDFGTTPKTSNFGTTAQTTNIGTTSQASNFGATAQTSDFGVTTSTPSTQPDSDDSPPISPMFQKPGEEPKRYKHSNIFDFADLKYEEIIDYPDTVGLVTSGGSSYASSSSYDPLARKRLFDVKDEPVAKMKPCSDLDNTLDEMTRFMEAHFREYGDDNKENVFVEREKVKVKLESKIKELEAGQFKVPKDLKKTKTPKQYQNVPSPVGMYIKNTPAPCLKQNVKPQISDTLKPKRGTPKPNEESPGPSFLPPRVYKPASNVGKVTQTKGTPFKGIGGFIPERVVTKRERIRTEFEETIDDAQKLLSEDLSTVQTDDKDMSIHVQKRAFK